MPLASHYSFSFVNEDNYLGVPFRSEPQKAYISDAWRNYIGNAGKKFTGGLDEFRHILKMYAAATGFEYTFYRNDHRYMHARCTHFETSSKGIDEEQCEGLLRGIPNCVSGL